MPREVFTGDDEPSDEWWVISGFDIRDMLKRVAEGADPDLVYIEEYANTDHHFIDEDD